MTDTEGKSVSDIKYGKAEFISKSDAGVTGTNGETPVSRATTVPQFENTIKLRIVPRLPRQSGNQAQTD